VKLTAPNALLGTGANQHWLVMDRGCVLIDGGGSLGAAVSIFPVELERAHAMVAVDALEDAAVLDTSVGVMSHVLYCSLLSRKFRGTLVTNRISSLDQVQHFLTLGGAVAPALLDLGICEFGGSHQARNRFTTAGGNPRLVNHQGH
jgi:hypothetical protein